jgi:hypothetical protein
MFSLSGWAAQQQIDRAMCTLSRRMGHQYSGGTSTDGTQRQQYERVLVGG